MEKEKYSEPSYRLWCNMREKHVYNCKLKMDGLLSIRNTWRVHNTIHYTLHYCKAINKPVFRIRLVSARIQIRIQQFLKKLGVPSSSCVFSVYTQNIFSTWQIQILRWITMESLVQLCRKLKWYLEVHNKDSKMD